MHARLDFCVSTWCKFCSGTLILYITLIAVVSAQRSNFQRHYSHSSSSCKPKKRRKNTLNNIKQLIYDRVEAQTLGPGKPGDPGRPSLPCNETHINGTYSTFITWTDSSRKTAAKSKGSFIPDMMHFVALQYGVTRRHAVLGDAAHHCIRCE